MADNEIGEHFGDFDFKMPLKTCKRNLVTGNTLRAVDAKRRAQYITQPILTKTLQIGMSKMTEDAHDGYLFPYRDDIKLNEWCNITFKRFVDVGNTGFTCVDEGGMQDHTVTYSLNKRKRWTLPELLKKNICGVVGDGVFDSHNNPQVPPGYDVTLVEHHKIHKRADCTGVYSTRLEDRTINPHKMHLDCKATLKSLGKKQSKKKTQNKKRAQKRNASLEDEESDEEFVLEKCEMRYDIYYPMPTHSAVTHNNKLMLDRQLRHAEDVAHPTSGKHARNYRGNGKYSCGRQSLWGEVYDMEEADGDLENDIMDWCRADAQNSEHCRKQTKKDTLYDLIKTPTKQTKRAKSAKKHKKNGKISRDEYVPPRKIVYMEKENIEAEKDTPKQTVAISGTNDHIPEAIPVEIYLEKDSLETDFLDENYPKLYKTLNALPQKLLFDVTDIVKKTLSQTTHDCCQFVDKLDLDSYLLLEIMNDCKELESSRHTKVGVTMLTNYNINQLQIETIHKDGDYTMEELLTAVAKFAVILAADSERFKMKDRMIQTTARQSNQPTSSAFGLIHRATQSHIRCHTANQFFQESSVWQELEGKTSLDMEQCDLTVNWDVVCAVCYELIDRSNRGSSLLPCQHWICNVCWAQYIKTQINSGAISIKCPEFKCNSVIDWPMIMCFAGPNLFNRHLISVQNITLNRDPSLIWCPKAGCGRIIVSNQSQSLIPVNVACQCGHTMCLQCKEECHWPATCDQAKLYIEKLIQTGDLKRTKDTSELKVNFKPCPKCKYPVQKNGGCPHMHCFCGHDFCWKCGGHMWTQRHGSCYTTNKDPYKFQKVLLKQEDHEFQASSIRSKSYVQALQHRQARTSESMEQCAKRAATLADSVKTERANLAIKRTSGVEPTKQIISSLVAQIQKRKELSDFIASVFNTLKELHRVAEHTYIAVQGRQSRSLATCLSQLEFIISQIQMVLMDGSPKGVVSELQYLMQCAEKCVTQIAMQTRPAHRKGSSSGNSSDEGWDLAKIED